MLTDKLDYPLLHLLKIMKGLRRAEHHAVDSHGVNGHRRRRHYERALCRGRKRHAYRMSAAEHERDGRLLHRGYHLGYRKPRLNVTAHRVQYYQKPVYLAALLYLHKLGDYMLVFCRLLPLGEQIMSLDLPYYRKAVYPRIRAECTVLIRIIFGALIGCLAPHLFLCPLFLFCC